MNLLRGSRAYLAGPIERCNDSASWRDKLKPTFKFLGIITWDPLVKPNWFIEECGHEFTASDQRNDLKVIQEKSSDESKYALHRNNLTRDTCLRLASSCDFCVCYVDGPTVGTFEEITRINDQGKPIIFLYNNCLDSCWRYVQFKNAIHVCSIDELIDYIVKVDSGHKVVDNKQWIFMPERWPDASSITSRSNE